MIHGHADKIFWAHLVMIENFIGDNNGRYFMNNLVLLHYKIFTTLSYHGEEGM